MYYFIKHNHSNRYFVFDRNYSSGASLRTLFLGKMYTEHIDNGSSGVLISTSGTDII